MNSPGLQIKVKVSPLQTMKAYGDVNARVDIFAALRLGRGRVASPTLGHLCHGKDRYSFYRRLSESQDQSGD